MSEWQQDDRGRDDRGRDGRRDRDRDWDRGFRDRGVPWVPLALAAGAGLLLAQPYTPGQGSVAIVPTVQPVAIVADVAPQDAGLPTWGKVTIGALAVLGGLGVLGGLISAVSGGRR